MVPAAGAMVPSKTQSSWKRAGGPKKKPFAHRDGPQVHPSTQEMKLRAQDTTPHVNLLEVLVTCAHR